MNNFKHGVPGKDWWAGFRRGNPDVVLRKAEKLSTVRSRMLNQIDVGSYMVELRRITKEHNLSPTEIWNMDETGLSLEHQPTRVVARQGIKAVPVRTGDSRQNITFLPCINAAGEKILPLVKEKKTERSLRSFNTHDGPIGARLLFQQKAWMDDSLGVEWFSEIFFKS